MRTMMKRCLKLYLRDKSSVFFSLLGVLIIFALYRFFIGDSILEGLDFVPDAKTLMNEWVVAGMLASCGMTTALGAYGIMVMDRAEDTVKDFYVSPVSTVRLTGGYLLAGFLISVVMSCFTFILGVIYIAADGGTLPSPGTVLAAAGICLMSGFASSAMACFLVSFLRSVQAYTTVSILVGTLIGFLTGSYICIGDLPEAVRWIIRCFPCAHAAAWLRQVLMNSAMNISFATLPEEALPVFQEKTGVIFHYGTYKATAGDHFMVLLLTGIVFYFLSAVCMFFKRRVDR